MEQTQAIPLVVLDIQTKSGDPLFIRRTYVDDEHRELCEEYIAEQAGVSVEEARASIARARAKVTM